MSEKRKKFEGQLDQLIQKGSALRRAMYYECYPDIFKRQIGDAHGEDQVEKYVKELPAFNSEYQGWYSESLALIKQVLPDRFKDFVSHYEYSRARKEITVENYVIRDYLQGLRGTRGISKDIVYDRSAAIPEFDQQLSMVEAAKTTLDSVLINFTSMLQADIFDSEVDSAHALAKSGFLRAAGAICGVVLEKHLKQVCNNHAITIKKKIQQFQISIKHSRTTM